MLNKLIGILFIVLSLFLVHIALFSGVIPFELTKIIITFLTISGIAIVFIAGIMLIFFDES